MHMDDTHGLREGVRRGGAVFAAELILREPLPPGFKITKKQWLA
jgi:hypothetical protein